jgi:MFS family permease
VIAAGIVALVVLGPSLLVHGVIWLLRKRLRPAPARPVDPATARVGILIVARDEVDRILDAVIAARELVPAGHVYVVSNGSTDGTAEEAERLGADVVETIRPLTTAAATAAGIQAFRLQDRFSYLLLSDAGTRLAPGHLERALPLFADPRVAAVDARLAPDWLPPRRILAAFRARRYVLTQSFGRGPRSAPATVSRGLPSVGRIYRTTVLSRLELDPPGATDPDLDLTLQLYRKRVGRVALCPGAPAVTATSVRLREHVRLTRRSVGAMWRAVRRGRVGFPLAAQLLELVVSAAVVTLVPLAALLLALPVQWAPLAAARSVTGPVELALGLVLADYVLTVAAALASRQPRYLLAGVLFPLLRVVDAVAVLLPAAGRAPERVPVAKPVPPPRPAPQPEPQPEPRRAAIPTPRREPRPARPPAGTGRRPWLVLTGWTLWTVAAAALVYRVVRALPTIPASAAEVTLTQVGYAREAGVLDDPGLPAVPRTLAMTDRQLAAYSWLTDPFGRHASVLTGTRELSLVAIGVLLLSLLLLTIALRLHPVVSAIALGVLATASPAITVFGAFGPGLLGAAWLGLAAVGAIWLGRALARDQLARIALAGLLMLVAAVAAVASAPLLAIPAGVAVATWLWFLDVERYDPDTTWRGHAVAALFLAGLVAAVLWRANLMLGPTGGVLAGEQRPALLAAVTVAAGAGLVVRRVRPVATGLLTGVGLAAGYGAQADVLVPALVAGTAVCAAMLLDAVVRSPAPIFATSLAKALTAAAAVAGLLIASPVAPSADHAALAGWASTQLGHDDVLTVPPDLWADLHRDLSGRHSGVDVRRAGDEPARGFVVLHGRPLGGQPLGRFGSLTLVTTQLDAGYLDPAPRARAGAQLVRNKRLTTSPTVRAELLAGRVDLRAMAVVASLCAQYDITFVRTEKSPHERGTGLPDRTIVVSTSDGDAAAVRDWLAAQEPPYAPAATRRTADGVAISWRLPQLRDGATG